MQIAVGLEIIHYLHCLLHFPFVVEVHFDVDTLSADVVEQGAQFVECHPAGHDALAACQNLFIEVIPFR